MNRVTSWTVGAACAIAALAGLSALPANDKEVRADRQDLPQDRGDVREDTRDIRGDRQDIRQDTRDIRSDKQDLVKDTQDVRQDRTAAAARDSSCATPTSR
jgi:hypothetical protein